MSAQPAFEAHFPPGAFLSWEDLQTIPDDQHWRYQLMEGQLIVSPSPGGAHQDCVLGLALLLRATCPPDLLVMLRPFDYAPRPGYVLQPDVLVVQRTKVEEQRVVEAPELVVEVLSPSSRSMDRSLKRLVYEEHGVPSYWIVDPMTPSLLVLELATGRYAEVAYVTGAQSWTAVRPFPVTVTPARLLDGRG